MTECSRSTCWSLVWHWNSNRRSIHINCHFNW